ncbi:hypothetical protein [Actinoplanes sp. L3-i22]|uniref:hypothetical protein n=1 Tax=Actinoplanes sp. L3-i22 TaxID=2836373 RepID=UPI001C742727|nr:hypothetical protein [Actinoplanes sp. L3-i22]BCY08324.1 hypothetical protein L3i22_034120 [Actinoplanes sp. L3-i22]
MTITGELQHQDGRITASLTIRPRAPFRTQAGSRTSFRMPGLLGFEAVPKFDPHGLLIGVAAAVAPVGLPLIPWSHMRGGLAERYRRRRRRNRRQAG